jgi:membrane-associated phospholipid phosphatase
VPSVSRLDPRRVGVLVAAWLGLTGVLIAVGTAVVHSSTVSAFDKRITSTAIGHRTVALSEAMKAITWLGSWVALVITAVVLLVLAVRGRLRWLAVLLAVVAWVGEAGGVTLAKHVVECPRPPREIWLITAHGWSWPSGHTATAVLVFAVLAMVVTHVVVCSRFIRVACWFAASIAIAAVGFSRIELGVHWTTDVVASLVFVSIWVLVIVRLFAAEFRDPTDRTLGET